MSCLHSERLPQNKRLQLHQLMLKFGSQETGSLRAQRFHQEIKGRFRKRVVLVNVPSFRFSFRGNLRMYPRSSFRSGGTSKRTLVPVFRSGGTSAKTTLLETTLLGSSEDWKNSRSPFGIEVFKRDWNFQAGHPPNLSQFSWGILKVKIGIFKRDWIIQARFDFFQSLEGWTREFCENSVRSLRHTDHRPERGSLSSLPGTR